MKRLMRDALTVVPGGEEVRGFILFGYGDLLANDLDLRSHGLEGARVGGTYRHIGDDEDWVISLWDVVVPVWPSPEDWIACVRGLFEDILQMGTDVAWLGSEGLTLTIPPYLFDPERMGGGVLAALTASGLFLPPALLDDPMRGIDDSQMLQLRAAAGV